MKTTTLCALMFTGLIAACGDNNTSSNVKAPGDDTTTKTKVLETGTALLEGKP